VLISNALLLQYGLKAHRGVAEGDVYFSEGFRLLLREELDFEAGLITSYGYEVYRLGERLFWYDDFPHPNEKPWLQHFHIINMCHLTLNITESLLTK